LSYYHKPDTNSDEDNTAAVANC